MSIEWESENLQVPRFKVEEFEVPEGAFKMDCKKNYRTTTVYVNVSLRKMMYFEQMIRVRGDEYLADKLFEIRCSHIRRLMALFNGSKTKKPRCLEFHYELKSVTVPVKVDDENDS